MTIHRAAEKFDVPRSTLHDHITGKVLAGTKSGPRAYLTNDEEEELVSFLTGSSTLGYSRTVKQVIDIVQGIMDKKGIDVTVSASWWKSFKMRHRDIVLRTPETLTHSRIVGASPAQFEAYFDLLEKTISSYDLGEHPCRIFNLDESRFPLNPKSTKVIARRGEKQPSVIGGERGQVSVLCCCNAGGYALPPMVIFDRKLMNPDLAEGVQRTVLVQMDGWIVNYLKRGLCRLFTLMRLLQGHYYF